jgi:hypothetical protein
MQSYEELEDRRYRALHQAWALQHAEEAIPLHNAGKTLTSGLVAPSQLCEGLDQISGS